MRILLLGGTDLTICVAQSILDMGMTIAGVADPGRTFAISYRRSGVENARFSNIGSWCAGKSIPCSTYADNDGLARFSGECSADFALAAGWYHMVPRTLRARFPRGAAGLHASLLPDLRGGAPLNWAILKDRRRTGISLFELGDGVDDGPIYGQRGFDIPDRAYIADLVELSIVAAIDLVRATLPDIASGKLRPAQQQGVATYALQRGPEDGRVDWTRPADEIDRLVRAVSRPYPGAYGTFAGKKVIVWRCAPVSSPEVYGAPGQLFRLPGSGAVGVVTGLGALAIEEAQTESGEDAMPILGRAANQRFDVVRAVA